VVLRARIVSAEGVVPSIITEKHELIHPVGYEEIRLKRTSAQDTKHMSHVTIEAFWKLSRIDRSTIPPSREH